MITTLPVTMLYSFLFWAAIVYTILACAQLALLEMTIKRQEPGAATYKTMSMANKKAIHKVLLKVGVGLLCLIALAVLDRVLIIN